MLQQRVFDKNDILLLLDLIAAAMLCWDPFDRATAESGLEAWERRNPERTRSSTPSVLSQRNVAT